MTQTAAITEIDKAAKEIGITVQAAAFEDETYRRCALLCAALNAVLPGTSYVACPGFVVVDASKSNMTFAKATKVVRATVAL